MWNCFFDLSYKVSITWSLEVNLICSPFVLPNCPICNILLAQSTPAFKCLASKGWVCYSRGGYRSVKLKILFVLEHFPMLWHNLRIFIQKKWLVVNKLPLQPSKSKFDIFLVFLLFCWKIVNKCDNEKHKSKGPTILRQYSPTLVWNSEPISQGILNTIHSSTYF